MRNLLLKNFLFVSIFWWVVTTLLFTMDAPSSNMMHLRKLMVLFPDADYHLPETIDLFSAAQIQLEIFKHWTLPILEASAFMVALGWTFGWVFSFWKRYQTDSRSDNHGKKWRGMKLSLGEIPMPNRLKRAQIDIEVDEFFSEVMNKMSSSEKKLLLEIISTLAAYPDAYAGDGHGVTLLEHTLNVINETMHKYPDEPIVILAAAAHDLGKITSFKKKGDKWVSTALHDKESAKHLALMPSFWELEGGSKDALLMAVKYDHSSGLMPTLCSNEEVSRLALDIQKKLQVADMDATKQEKKDVIEEVNIEDVIWRAFHKTLAETIFQNKEIAGRKASAMKKTIIVEDEKGNKKKFARCFLIEQNFREAMTVNLNADVAASLGGKYRQKTKIAPITIELLKVLYDKKLLVQTISGVKTPVVESIWDIVSGRTRFNGVIIIDLPENMMDMAPSLDTDYDIEVKQPTLASRADQHLSISNVSGLYKNTEKKEPIKNNNKVNASIDKEENIKESPIIEKELGTSK